MKKVTIHIFNSIEELYVPENIKTNELVTKICRKLKITPKLWGLDDHRRMKYEIYNPMLPDGKILLSEYYLYPIVHEYNYNEFYNILLYVVLVCFVILILFLMLIL